MAGNMRGAPRLALFALCALLSAVGAAKDVDNQELRNEVSMMERDGQSYVATDAGFLNAGLSGEVKALRDVIAFGIISSADVIETRAKLLRLWCASRTGWGAVWGVGCICLLAHTKRRISANLAITASSCTFYPAFVDS